MTSGDAEASESSEASEGSEASEASGEESSGDAAASDSDKGNKGKKFPWGLVIFLSVLVIFVIVCLICAKVNNRFGRWLKNFFKDYKSEIKKITWPSRQATFKGTAVVLVCLIISGVVVGLLDFGLAKLIELFSWLVSK